MKADLGNGVGQVRIAEQKPATWSNAVRLVLKLVRPQLIEVVETATTTTLVICSTEHSDTT